MKRIATVTLLAALALVPLRHPGGAAAVAGPHEFEACPRACDTPTADARAQALLAGPGSPFVPNDGQWEHRARFVHKSGPMSLFLQDRGWVVDLVEPPPRTGAEKLRGVALRMTFAGDAHAPRIVGENEFAGHHNYFLGNDESRWRTEVPLYGSVRYERLYPGIDLRLREADGVPEYDLLLQPGADLSRVVVHVEGGQRMTIRGDGSLAIETELGPLTQLVPRTWQTESDGSIREVVCDFMLLGANRYGFAAPGWDGNTSLTIDPGLVWSTFLGESVSGYSSVDASGIVTIAGNPFNNGFPTTLGAYSRSFTGSRVSGYDVSVSRLDPSKTGTAQLLYSTYLGGSLNDGAGMPFVDANGVVTVGGETTSSNFPTTRGAFATGLAGGYDAFVSRLDPRRKGVAQLVYSTLFGGNGHDRAAISVGAGGVVTFAGRTASTNLPTTSGAYDRTHNGGRDDAFLSRLDPNRTGRAQLVYSTYLGGGDMDHCDALSVDASGVATLTGYTRSRSFPTTAGAYATAYNGGIQDAWVSRLDPTRVGSAQLVYSTFLGGMDVDQGHALVVDTAGVVTVAGTTKSTDFPTARAYDSTYNGGREDAFVSRLDPGQAGSAQLVYSTFLGGMDTDSAKKLAIDAAGVVTCSGITKSTDFPTTNGAYDTTHAAGYDLFVGRLDPSRTGSQQLLYSTYLGGGGEELVHGLAVGASGVVTVTGSTRSSTYPTTSGAYRTIYGSPIVLACATRLDMLPTGVSRYGSSTAGCAGPLSIGVTSSPQIGNAAFSLSCNNAPPSALGVALLGVSGLATPFSFLGADLWVDPAGAWFLGYPVASDGRGVADFPLPIPNRGRLVGGRFDLQFAWAGPTSPPPCPLLGVSASDAMAVTIQP